MTRLRVILSVLLLLTGAQMALPTMLAQRKSSPRKAKGKNAVTPVKKIPVASPEQMTVFGLVLGKPLALPECFTSEDRSGGPCFRRPFQDDTEIAFHIEATPPLLWQNDCQCVEALVLDGYLEGIRFATSGVVGQDRVLESLTEKYGPPTTTHASVVENQAGGRFDTTDARWLFTNLEVTFLATLGRTDKGVVSIYTSRGKAEKEKQRKAREEKAPKF